MMNLSHSSLWRDKYDESQQISLQAYLAEEQFTNALKCRLPVLLRLERAF